MAFLFSILMHGYILISNQYEMSPHKKIKNPSRHHRKPRSKGGGNEPENISVVPNNKHEAYHTLFENEEPREVARQLNELWIDPSWVLIAVRRTEINGRTPSDFFHY